MEWTVKLEARTGWGEVQTFEVGTLKRRVIEATAEEVGLLLDEAKTLLANLQRHMVQSQISEYVTCARVCTSCRTLRGLRDRRSRVLQTLFGTVTVEAPRIKLCSCIDTMGLIDLSCSPLSELLPDRCTPELRRLQAELGTRHSFREAARLLSTFLPSSSVNHASVRNRLHRVSAELENSEKRTAHEMSNEAAVPSEVIVMIDSAHIRARPEFQSRHIDVVVGKVEAPNAKPRRFALVPNGTDQPLPRLRAALTAQGWRPGNGLTVISDGEPALPNLIFAAIKAPVTHILDWFHLSMRIRHIEQALKGLYSLKPTYVGPLSYLESRVNCLRHLLWNGYHERTQVILWSLHYCARQCAKLNGASFKAPVDRFLRLCVELRGYIANNTASIVNYRRRYHSQRPVSTSRAESCVNEIANARMNKRRQMRWSPVGAHRVASTRAAVLDGRLSYRANEHFMAA